MGPKVEAACRFALTTGHTAAIGALPDIAAIVRGEKGTLVDRHFSSLSFH
jgi:carbamate kinase